MLNSRPDEQKIQPIGLLARREAINAPTVMHAIMKLKSRMAGKPEQQKDSGTAKERFKKTNRNVMSATQQVAVHIAQASREATRLLIILLSGFAIITIPITTKAQKSEFTI